MRVLVEIEPILEIFQASYRVRVRVRIMVRVRVRVSKGNG